MFKSEQERLEWRKKFIEKNKLQGRASDEEIERIVDLSEVFIFGTHEEYLALREKQNLTTA